MQLTDGFLDARNAKTQYAPKPPVNRIRNKLINLYIKSSSILSLRLNKSNTLSTYYSVYSVSRYKDQKTNALWSMKHSGIKNLGFRLFLILVHHVVLPKILQKEVLYPNRG